MYYKHMVIEHFPSEFGAVIQFGYVTFFSWAFPLAPLFALLNNIIGMRADAYKLCYHRQRPIAHKASGIGKFLHPTLILSRYANWHCVHCSGVWFNVLQMMSLLAVLTNCAHLALASREFQRLFPHMTDAQKIFIVFLIEVSHFQHYALKMCKTHHFPHNVFVAARCHWFKDTGGPLDTTHTFRGTATTNARPI